MCSSAFALDPKEFDRTTKACTDLNAYVNRSWIAANPIPDDESVWGAFSVLRVQSYERERAILDSLASNADRAQAGSVESKLGTLWRDGMNLDAIEAARLDPLTADLARIEKISTRDQLVDYLSESFERGFDLVFSIRAQIDYRDASKTIAYANQGGLGLPTAEYYEAQTYAPIREAYQRYLAQMFTALGSSDVEAKKQASAVFAIETRLAKASLRRVELREPQNRYHWVSYAEAEQATPQLPWRRLMAAQGVATDDGFSLSQPRFFAELDRMIGDVSIADWRAYLRAHLARTMSAALTESFAQINFDFYGRTLNGRKEMQPRWRRVLTVVDEQMSMAVGQLYVAKHFPPESKARAQKLVDNLRIALKVRLERLDWMSAETKKKALEKWATFTPKIGYPERWRDWSGLNFQGRGFYSDVLALKRFNRAWEMSKIGKPLDRTEWSMPPQAVNAYYSPSRNEIVFPAAILQPPFFDAKADDAVNYGGIGAVIGHEMLHGFDDQGSKFDASGNLRNWWTDEDRARFKLRADKLVDEFNAFEIEPGVHVNGQLTLGENIADFGGLQVARDALHIAHPSGSRTKKIDGFTQDQRFFLNFAAIWRSALRPAYARVLVSSDPHAPAPFRANAAPRNMPEFERAFSCEPGDAMTKSDRTRVSVW